MTTLEILNKDNYGRQVLLIYSMINKADILGALDHDTQNKVTGLMDAKNVTHAKEKLHTNIVKDPDSENITDLNEYKIKEIKYGKYKRKQEKEASLKDTIFAALSNDYQDLLKKELNVTQHQFAKLSDVLKFLEKSFGTTTTVTRRKEQKTILPVLPLPQQGETGEDMIRKIHTILNRFKEKHLADMTKPEVEVHLGEILLDAIDNTPHIKALFYKHVDYGEDYQSICKAVQGVYNNIEMTNIPMEATASAASRDTRGRTRDRSRSKSPIRSQSNLKSGKSYSPQRSNSPKKYCEFHGSECNHSTDDCYAFKKLVMKFSSVVTQWTNGKKASFASESDYDD